MSAHVKILCNLDRYSSLDFPQNLQSVPRVGEYVEVTERAKSKFDYPYPNNLQVCQVVHKEMYVEVHVWYSKTQHELIMLENKSI